MLKKAITRAARAIREDAKLHLVSLSSLTVAFLCLATALWAIANLTSVADSWGRSGRMSIYLTDAAQTEEIEQLRLLLEGLPEVTEVALLSSEQARAIDAKCFMTGSIGEIPA